MHCQTSIFEIKKMVKIGAIFKSCMPPQRYELTCPPKGLLLVLLTMGKLAVDGRWHVGFKYGMKMTPIFTIIFISKMLIKQISHN